MNERPMNTLYHYPLSPFSRKVRLSLAEKKIEVGLVEERYWEKDAEFMRRNPAGKVPILKMGSRMMSDSTAICEYLEEIDLNLNLLKSKIKIRIHVSRNGKIYN